MKIYVPACVSINVQLHAYQPVQATAQLNVLITVLVLVLDPVRERVQAALDALEAVRVVLDALVVAVEHAQVVAGALDAPVVLERVLVDVWLRVMSHVIKDRGRHDGS